MTFWSALVAIVAILAWANLRGARYRGGHPLINLSDAMAPPPQHPAAAPALEHNVAQLRARIEVLERIITDERDTRRLAQDIEALRE